MNPIKNTWNKATAEQRDEFVKHICSMFPSLVSKIMYSHYNNLMEGEYGREKTEK